MKQLKPNDISVMRTAIGLYAQPFGVESFAVMLNEDKTEPKSEEERVTRDLLHRLDQYEYGLAPCATISRSGTKNARSAFVNAKRKSAPRPSASRVSAEYKHLRHACGVPLLFSAVTGDPASA